MSTIVASNLQAAAGAGTVATLASINGGAIAGTRNRIINGAFTIDQRALNVTTLTAGAALLYQLDRWYVYSTGGNPTGARIIEPAGRFRYRFTGAAGVTAIGCGQRIEQLNSADLAGTTATLSVDLANSLLTSVTWTAYYATTADTFGTLASPTRTQIDTGTFTVNSTVTRYSTSISVPSAATTGIEIVFTVGAQTSGTWTIGDVQLERGTVATPFERRSYGQELALCQRYCEVWTAPANELFCGGYAVTTTSARGQLLYKATKRSAPTIAFSSNTDFLFQTSVSGSGSNATSTAMSSTVPFFNAALLNMTTSGLAPGAGGSVLGGASTSKITVDSEL
jgi:hypothetical protein